MKSMNGRFRGVVLMLLMLGLTLAAFTPGVARADGVQYTRGTPVILRATTGSPHTYVPPASAQLPTAPTAVINVTYNGFTPQARAAFQHAVDIWAGTIQSSVPIEVVATWETLPPGVLGSAGATLNVRDFAGAPRPGTYYPVALANKLAGTDLFPPVDPSYDPQDIDASFSSTINWYYGLDGQPPAGQYDLVTVVLHELGHGLGFVGSATVIGANGRIGFSDGRPVIYDTFVQNGSGQPILSFPNNSPALAAQLQSNDLFFHGPQAMAANGGVAPKLYAPATWEQGSSFSHWDEATYPAGNVNSLMTPQLADAEAIHTPGPLTSGLMLDIGWNLIPTAITMGSMDASGGNSLGFLLAIAGLAVAGMALVIRRRQM